MNNKVTDLIHLITKYLGIILAIVHSKIKILYFDSPFKHKKRYFEKCFVSI